MEIETFRIDKLTKEEMNKILEKLHISKSSFIRICIIEKLQRIGVDNENSDKHIATDN